MRSEGRGSGAISFAFGPKTVMGRWAYKDPAAAAQWLNEFEAGALRSDLTRMLVNAWKKKDVTALKQWPTASVTQF